jgi:hypothetical protein
MPFTTYAPVNRAQPFFDLFAGGLTRFQAKGTIVAEATGSNSQISLGKGTYLLEYAAESGERGVEFTINGGNLRNVTNNTVGEVNQIPFVLDTNTTLDIQPGRGGYARVYDMSEFVDISDTATPLQRLSPLLPLSELSLVVGLGTGLGAVVDDSSNNQIVNSNSAPMFFAGTSTNITISSGDMDASVIPLSSLLDVNFTVIDKALSSGATHTVSSGKRLVTAATTELSVNGGEAEVPTADIFGRLTVAKNSVTANNNVRLIGIEVEV